MIDKIDLIKVTQSQIVNLVVRFWSSSCSERGVINPASFNRSEEKRKSKGQCSFACHAQCCFRGKDGRWSHQSHLYRLTYMRCDIAMVVGCDYSDYCELWVVEIMREQWSQQRVGWWWKTNSIKSVADDFNFHHIHSRAGLHNAFHPTIRNGSTWSKFRARGEHGDVFLFSNLGALWFSEK